MNSENSDSDNYPLTLKNVKKPPAYNAVNFAVIYSPVNK